MCLILIMILCFISFHCEQGENIFQQKSVLIENHIKRDSLLIFIENDSSLYRHKRSLRAEYPSGQLENKVPTSFFVEKSKKKHCGLFSKDSDTVTSYKVMKLESEFGEIYTNYYVVPGSVDFKRTQDPEVEEFHIQRRYSDQIAYAVCSPGWVEKVWVNSGKEEDEEDTDVRINARRCGIASVLSELCFRDPDIVQVVDSNKVFEKLKEAEVEDIEIKTRKLREKCNSLIGTEMSADPKDAAFGYFNAAIRANYLQMVVQERFHDTKDNLSFNIYSTKKAKENYDPDTGSIGACEQNEKCNGIGAYWYFCRKN